MRRITPVPNHGGRTAWEVPSVPNFLAMAALRCLSGRLAVTAPGSSALTALRRPRRPHVRAAGKPPYLCSWIVPFWNLVRLAKIPNINSPETLAASTAGSWSVRRPMPLSRNSSTRATSCGTECYSGMRRGLALCWALRVTPTLIHRTSVRGTDMGQFQQAPLVRREAQPGCLFVIRTPPTAGGRFAAAS